MRDVVIIASGPSLTQSDVDHCRNRAAAIVVNDNHRLAPWADILYAADPEWWDHHQGVPNFTGRKFTQDATAAKRWHLEHIESVEADGLSLDPTRIHRGGNSGYQAIGLAVHLFAPRRILLLGFDMKSGPSGRSHWFGDHPGRLHRSSNWAGWATRFETMLPDLDRLGIDVINCSRSTAITAFPRATIDAALA